MALPRTFEDISLSITSLDIAAVKRHILNFRGNVNLDFSKEYLDKLSDDRLKHILMAAMMVKLKKRAS